jgi:hypothetical protein
MTRRRASEVPSGGFRDHQPPRGGRTPADLTALRHELAHLQAAIEELRGALAVVTRFSCQDLAQNRGSLTWRG